MAEGKKRDNRFINFKFRTTSKAVQYSIYNVSISAHYYCIKKICTQKLVAIFKSKVKKRYANNIHSSKSIYHAIYWFLNNIE